MPTLTQLGSAQSEQKLQLDVAKVELLNRLLDSLSPAPSPGVTQGQMESVTNTEAQPIANGDDAGC